VGVRLCLSARPWTLLEFINLNLPDFVEVSGQPLTAAWLCFLLKYGCLAPVAANAHVSGSCDIIQAVCIDVRMISSFVQIEAYFFLYLHE
jgi:hypothetical protein